MPKATEATKAPETANAPATTEAAEAPKFQHAHAEAGVTGQHYAGLSPYLNANRKPSVPVGNARYAYKPAQLTPRMLGLLTAIRNAYGTKQFTQRGFDNAATACLIGAGMLAPVSGTGQRVTNKSGVECLADGEKPLALRVTKAGLAHGKATA